MSRRRTEPEADKISALAAELHAVSGKLKRRLREQASAGDLTQSQLAVLGHLDRQGPTTVTALARMEGVRPQSMGATVAGLEALGLIKGSPDATDGRQTILSLTPACRELIRSSTSWRSPISFTITWRRQICARAHCPIATSTCRCCRASRSMPGRR